MLVLLLAELASNPATFAIEAFALETASKSLLVIPLCCAACWCNVANESPVEDDGDATGAWAANRLCKNTIKDKKGLWLYKNHKPAQEMSRICNALPTIRHRIELKALIVTTKSTNTAKTNDWAVGR